MALYFAYGSNLSSARLIARLGALEIVGVARLAEYRHRFNKHGNDDTAKGNIEPASGNRVLGVLYRLAPAQWSVLEQIESGYRQLAVSVERAAVACDAQTFCATRLSETLEPTEAYLEHYRAGAREHGLPAAYMRQILPTWFR